MHLSQLACNLSSYFIFTALRSTPWDQVLNLFYIPNGYILCFGLGGCWTFGKTLLLREAERGTTRGGLAEKEQEPWGGVEGESGPSDHAVLRFRSKVGVPALRGPDSHRSQWTARTPGPSSGGRLLPTAALGWEREAKFL